MFRFFIVERAERILQSGLANDARIVRRRDDGPNQAFCSCYEFDDNAGSGECVSGALRGGEEVVHGPRGFEALLPDQRGELRVVADAVQREMHKDGLA